MGSNDCSIFAIAFAVALCSGKDPRMETYEQNKMRNHLHQCFSVGKLDHFPPSPSRQCQGTRNCISIQKTVKIFCTCRQPWYFTKAPRSLNFVQCSQCKERYHMKCVSITEKQMKSTCERSKELYNTYHFIFL